MARRRRRKVFFTGDPNGLQPGDDVGNRIKKQAQRMPPDDIGNRKSDDPEHIVPPDDLGNRIDANPTHEMSGIVWGNVDPKSKGAQRRRRLKSGGPAQRIGRYFAGGVNPMVSGDASRAQEAQEGDHKRRREQRQQERASNRNNNDQGDAGGHEESSGGNSGGSGGSKRKKRFDQVDGHQALEVNRRRAQRFFEFEEDDRFKYSLKTPAADKRKDSEQCVQRILDEAGRDATAKATLLPDGDRPKVLVTIEDRGPSPDVAKDKQSKDAADPLFPMGSGTLMSLNYLVNKIVNRYPDDRIRLAILPVDEEQNYLEALEAHIKTRKEAPSKDEGANGKPPPKKTDAGADKPKAKEKAKKADKVEAAPVEEPAADQAPEVEVAEEAEAPTKKVKAAKKAAAATKAGAKKVTKKVTKKAPAKSATSAKKVVTKKVTKKATTKKVTKKAAATKKAPAKKVTKKVAKKAPAKKATKKAAKKAK